MAWSTEKWIGWGREHVQRIHGCTRRFVHISKVSWSYLGLLNYCGKGKILYDLMQGEEDRIKYILCVFLFGKERDELFFGGKLEKWVVEICGWWVMTYLLHCSFPIHQNFLLMTDTIGMQNRPHHLSLFNPHHYFLTFVLFHLGTQRVYAHAKGKKNI